MIFTDGQILSTVPINTVDCPQANQVWCKTVDPSVMDMLVLRNSQYYMLGQRYNATYLTAYVTVQGHNLDIQTLFDQGNVCFIFLSLLPLDISGLIIISMMLL